MINIWIQFIRKLDPYTIPVFKLYYMMTYVLVVIVGILFPVLSIFYNIHMKVRILSNPSFKVIEYKRAFFLLWLLTMLIGLNSIFAHSTSIPLGLSITRLWPTLIVCFLISILFLLMMRQLRNIRDSNAQRVLDKMKEVAFLLPGSRQEFYWFVTLSFTAGICEEILFRGFLYNSIRLHLPVIVSVFLTNVSFAVAHSGSGAKNITGSFILGVIFSMLYLITGNLLASMLLHAAIDLNTGVTSFKAIRVLKREQ